MHSWVAASGLLVAPVFVLVSVNGQVESVLGSDSAWILSCVEFCPHAFPMTKGRRFRLLDKDI